MLKLEKFIFEEIVMTREQFIMMDDIMALSWINTKLRDEYSDLECLCDDLDFVMQEVLEKFSKINYTYNNEKNRFF